MDLGTAEKRVKELIKAEPGFTAEMQQVGKTKLYERNPDAMLPTIQKKNLFPC